ncbi:hypothetical protein ACFL20_10190, partial [Spirochaetota bacterium]
MNLYNKSYIALFDLDNTIISGNTGKMLVKEAYKSKIISTFNLAEGIFLSMLHKYRIVSSKYAIKRMAKWLQGIKETVILDLALEIFVMKFYFSLR